MGRCHARVWSGARWRQLDSNMSREGRLGFPRPFGNILKEYRPLIPDVPINVGKVASALEDNAARSVGVTEVKDGLYSIDFVLNAKGADEFSKSSLQFDSGGNFLGGEIRTGIVSVEGNTSKLDVNEDWHEILYQRVGLDKEEDDVDTILRRNDYNGQSVVPHVSFTTRSAGVFDGDTSPIKTNEIIEIAERIMEEWNKMSSKYTLTPRVSKGDMQTGKDSTEDDDIGDMMGHL